MTKPDQDTTAAGGSRLQRAVGRPTPKRASVGDTVECDVRVPYPQTHRLTLLTPEATAFANELLLARTDTPWRLLAP